MREPVHVQLRLPGPVPLAWHLDLVRALAASPGTTVGVTTVAAPARTRGLRFLLWAERRLHGLPDRGAGPATASELAALTTTPSTAARSTCIDLTGAPDGGTHGWTLEYDGRVGEQALVGALLAGRFPRVDVVDARGEPLASGRPGSEWPGVTAAALDDVLAGCVILLLAAVRGEPLCLPVQEEPVVPRSRRRSPLHQVARTAVGVTARRAARLVVRTPHWRVGWRYDDGPGTLATGQHPATGWTDLPDDGHHFYADPFPIVVGGRTYVFVEDFDHRIGRGVISVVEFGPDGPLGTPVPVLRHTVHLSYPCVFEDDGEVWMIPETSAAGTVELYRATSFPRQWTREAVLLQDIDANDVTAFRHGGRWWLAATVRQGGSSSDALHLWYAPTLRGPWTPHAHQPVVLDIASARPAGRMAYAGGRLLRPAQDGRAGYGAALAVVEVLVLDPERYEQRVVNTLGPGPLWPGRRLHTLNRAGRLEVIDGSGRSLRRPHWPRRRKGRHRG